MAHDEDTGHAGHRPSTSIGMVLAVILIAAFVVLAVQNTGQVDVQWLSFDGQQPLWAILAVTGVAGLLVAKLIGYAWHHRSS